jgi:hypothetical protein
MFKRFLCTLGAAPTTNVHLGYTINGSGTTDAPINILTGNGYYANTLVIPGTGTYIISYYLQQNCSTAAVITQYITGVGSTNGGTSAYAYASQGSHCTQTVPTQAYYGGPATNGCFVWTGGAATLYLNFLIIIASGTFSNTFLNNKFTATRVG